MGAAPKAIGVDMVYVAPLVSDGMNSRAPQYGTPRWIPELTKLSVKIQSDATKFSSDNRLSEVVPKTSGAQIGMSVGGMSLDSYNAIQGWDERESNDPGRLDDLQKTPDYVALGYRRKMLGKTADGRQRFRYVWLFKVLFLPPDDETETEPEKGATVQPDTLAGEAIALDAFTPEHDYWRYVYDNGRTARARRRTTASSTS
jgi:phi13 family phage major tail protein